MRPSRRGFLTAGAAAAAALAPGLRSLAAPSAPRSEQNAGWCRFAFGDFEITVLSDGNLSTPTDLIGTNEKRETVEAFLQSAFQPTDSNYAHTNHLLIDTGEARVLVDVGSGDKFQPSAGKLLANMEAAGIDPSSVTHVALTHAHPDHVWGMMDDFGDAPRMPEAAYAIGAAEYDWWTAEDRIGRVPEAMQAMVVGAQNALKPVAEKTSMMKDGGEIVPGVRMMSTPGHTAGHMSVLIESKGETLLATGDAINHAQVSFERPKWHFGFDVDKEQAVATRLKLLDMMASDRMTLVGYHMPFPGVGHVARDKAEADAYRFIPAPWRWSA